jgi:Glycosyl transferase WecG/TagA/CpsF family
MALTPLITPESRDALPFVPRQELPLLDPLLPEPPRFYVGGVPIGRVTLEYALAWVLAALTNPEPHKPLLIVGPNAQLVTLAARVPRFADALRCASLSVPDGISIVLAARLLGTPLPERVTGGDLMERLCIEAARHNLSVFFLGGLPGAAEMTARKFERLNPGFRTAETAALLRALRTIPPSAPAFAIKSSAQSPTCFAWRSALPGRRYGCTRTVPPCPSARRSQWARLSTPRRACACALLSGRTSSGLNGSTACCVSRDAFGAGI